MKNTTAQQVDEYISIKDQIAALEAKLEPVSASLRSFGPSVLVGTLGAVEVSEVSGRKTTEWALVCAAANVPQATVDKYTKLGNPSTRLTINKKVV